MEFRKETVNIEQLVGNVNAQAVVEGELTLPAMKPDIADLLLVQGKVTMGNVECVAGKLLMDGMVAFCVVYRGEEGITGFEATAGFKNSVDMEDAKPGMKGNVTAYIQQIDSYQLNERKLHVNAVVEMECGVFSEGEEAVITDIQDGMDYETLRVNSSVPDIQRSQDVLSIKEDVALPSGTPPVDEVLFANGYARIKDIREQAGEMIVTGEIKIQVTYSSTEHNLEQTQLVLPAEFVLKCEKMAMDSRNFAQLKIQEIYVRKADEEGKVVTVEAELSAQGCCVNQNELELISDCYSTLRQVDLKHKNLQTMIPVSSENTRTTIKTKIFIPDLMPPCERPIVCFVNPVITQKTIVTNGVELQGIFNISLVYEQQDGQKIAYNTQAPFAFELEAKGLNSAMNCDADLAVESCYASGNTGSEVELKVALDIELRCNQNWSVPVVASITEGDEKEEPSMGIAIYFANEGETLWSIAKRFNMKEDMILRYNPSVNAKEGMSSGQKLLLFRRSAS